MGQIPDAVKSEITAVELRIRNWILAGLLVNIVGWIPVIFFIGSIYQNIVDTEHQVESHEGWMLDKGYRPNGKHKE